LPAMLCFALQNNPAPPAREQGLSNEADAKRS
jgi:hypothetical protein